MTTIAETIRGIFRDLQRRILATTGRPTEVVHWLIPAYILEVEDVLFHLNSAVMMPDRPAGRSSTQGTEDDATDPDDAETEENQNRISGVQAIAIAYKQFEFDPEKRLLIAGHTDTSGTAAFNFELSALRAKNIQFLLEGRREEWAEICAGRHRIEDYQQIMQWIKMNTRWGWNCDPEGLDDRWGDKTKGATERFIAAYNDWVLAGLAPDGSVPLPPDIFNRIKNDPNHKWPLEMWRAVYDVYTDETAAILGVNRAQLQSQYRTLVAFVDPDKPYVACGESFPIDDAEKDNYRSQQNRRVEMLFFDQDEIPVLTCPERVNTVHTAPECPLWHRLHYRAVYISPEDLNAVAYHLKFVYYDRVAGAIKDVPNGLNIRVFDNRSTDPIGARIRYSDGVYEIKIPNHPDRTELHFEFETTDKWVFTDTPTSTPTIVTRPAAEIAALPFAERVKYYDLPAKWSSVNYWTRYGGDIDQGDRFVEVMRTHLGLKPYGGNISDPSQPIIFSLDDIVLLDQIDGTQDIKDADHQTPPQQKDLSNRSRVKIFVVDTANGHLKLYKRGADANTARVPFERNLIVETLDDVKTARVVFFRNGFYTIGNKRTRELTNWQASGFVVGARAALRSDTDFHTPWVMGGGTTSREFSFTGDYELHYFHHLYLDGEHPVSYVVPYISISFIRDSRAAGTATNPIPTGADVLRFVDEGCYNAMDRWNIKEFFFDETTASATSELARPFFFFDECETFNIPDAQSPTGIDFEEDEDGPMNALFGHPAVRTAQRNALNGKSMFLALVCRDDDAPTPYGRAFQHQRRKWGREYSIFKLHKSAYFDTGNAVASQVTEEGQTFGVLTLAHEIGHAIGDADEYAYSQFVIEWTDATGNTQRRRFHDYRRDFECYSMETNNPSMMKFNMAPRLHQIWYYLHKLNAEIAMNQIPQFHPSARRFVARFRRGGTDLTYHRGNLTVVGGARRLTLGTTQISIELTRPVVVDEHFRIPGATDKQLRLALFHTGQDLSSLTGLHQNQNNYEYQGVLTIGALIEVDWENDSGDWQPAEQSARLSTIQNSFKGWSGQYRLVGGARGITRILLHFQPGFSATSDARSNHKGQFYRSNAAAGNARVYIHSPLIGSNRLRIHRNATGDEVARFLLNIPVGGDALAALTYLRDWANSQLSENYTLERI